MQPSAEYGYLSCLGATQAKVGHVGGAKNNAVHRLVTELSLLMSLAIVRKS